jgi:hypothetical protein
MESVILKNLATNETYARKVHPFLKEEYFSGNANKKIFNLISNFITKYNSLPTREAVDISLSKLDLVSEDEYTECSKCIESIFTETDLTDINWLSLYSKLFIASIKYLNRFCLNVRSKLSFLLIFAQKMRKIEQIHPAHSRNNKLQIHDLLCTV